MSIISDGNRAPMRSVPSANSTHRGLPRSVWLVMLTVTIVLAACQQAADGNARTQEKTFEVNWPLGRGGQHRVRLIVPNAYALANRAAEAMEKNVYPDGRPKFNDDVHEQLLLEALWPDLQPDSEQIHRESAVPGGGRMLSALIESAAVEDYGGRHYDALQSVFDIANDWSTKNLCISPFEKHNYEPGAKTKCYSRDFPDVKRSEFGLERVGVDFDKYPDIPEDSRFYRAEDDIYSLRDQAGKLQTVILCNAKEAKTVDDGPQYMRVSQCEHKFVSKRLNALISINYRRVYLKNWREIQAAWENLISTFVVGGQQSSRKRK